MWLVLGQTLDVLCVLQWLPANRNHLQVATLQLALHIGGLPETKENPYPGIEETMG
jgi:hypothetical protein